MYVCRLVSRTVCLQSDGEKWAGFLTTTKSLPKLYEKFIFGYFKRTHPRFSHAPNSWIGHWRTTGHLLPS